MKIKTSELTNITLAYAVGVADKRIMRNGIGGSLEVRGRTEDGDELPEGWDMWMLWCPQASWSQAGPIIDRERISIVDVDGYDFWKADKLNQSAEPIIKYGPTPLIAVCRCYVASKLGDEVEVPDELIKE